MAGLPVRKVRTQESEQVDSPTKVNSSFSYSWYWYPARKRKAWAGER